MTVTAANLSLSGSGIYNGTTAVAGSTLTATGVNGESFSVTGSGNTTNLSNANIQTNSTLASVTGLVLGSSSNGGLSNNYNALSTTGSSYSITPAPLGITVTGTYNGSTTFTTSNSTITASGLIGSESISSVTANSKNVGSGNYVTAISGANGFVASNYAIYSGNEVGTTGTLTSGVRAGTVSGTTNTGGTNTVTVTAANLSLSGSGIYNGTTAVAGSTLTATGVNGESFSVTGSGNTTNLSNANIQTNSTLASVTGLVLGSSSNGGLSNNYNALSTTGSSYSITPAPLGITVTGTYNGSTTFTTSNSTITASGLIGSESISSVTANSKNVGSGNYVTAISGANGFVASNYAIYSGNEVGTTGTLTSGVRAGTVSGTTNTGGTNTVTVTPATVSLSATKTYDGNANLGFGTVTISTGVAGETLTYSGVIASDFNVATVGKYITAITLGDCNGTGCVGVASNYRLPTLSVATAPVTITQLSSVTYTGSAGGSWSNGANWTTTSTLGTLNPLTGATPTLGNVANIIVPANYSVSYDSAMAGLTPSAFVAITNNGTIGFANTSSVTVIAPMTGTGTININSGSTVKLGASSALGSPSAITVNGTLDLNSYALSVGSITGTAGIITNNAGSTTSTLTTGSANTNTSYSGAIQDGVGALALVKVGTGTQTLSGNNAYTQGVTISSGVLSAGSASALGLSAVNIGSSGTLDLAYSGTITLNSTLSMSAGSAITNSTNNSNLTVGTTSTLAGNITTAGVQTYTGAVTLADNATLNASLISTNSAVVGGSNALTVNGNLTTAGAFTGLSSLSVSGTTNLGANITTSGAQAYTGAVILGTNTMLSTTSSPISFGSTIDGTSAGSQSLTLTTGSGSINFAADVGATKALANLTVAGVSGTSTAQTTSLHGNVITSGMQSYGGNLIVGSTTINLVTTGAASTGGNLSVAGNIDGALTGANSLYISTGVGTTLLAGNVGATTALANLGLGGIYSVSGQGVVNFSYTGGIQTYIVPTGVTSLTFTAYGAAGGAAISPNITSSLVGGLGGGVTGVLSVTPGEVLYITVGGAGGFATGGYNGGGLGYSASSSSGAGGGGGASSIATSTGLLRTLSSNPSSVLVVAGGGGGAGFNSTNPSIGGGGGGTTGGDAFGSYALAFLSYGTGGTQSAGGTNSYNSWAVSSGPGSFGQGGAANSPYCYSGVCAGAGGGGGYYGGGGGVQGGGGGGSSYTNSNYVTSVTANYQGVNSGNGSVSLGTGAVTGFNSAAQTGGVTIVGSINVGALKTGGTNFNINLNLKNNPSSIASSTTFNNTGSLVLGVSNSGQTLTVSGLLNATAPSSINIGSNITTSTTQTYGSAVTLTADTTLVGTTVTTASTLDGGANSLTVTGNLTSLGILSGLSSLSVSGSANLGANVTSTGSQSYAGAVILGTSITLSTSNSPISFATAVDGMSSGTQGLTLTTGAGAINFTSAVGATTPLASLTITGVSGTPTSQTTTLGGNITTSGTQNYGGNISVAANQILNASSVTVAGNVSDASVTYSLTFNGALSILGNVSGLSSLIVNSTASTNNIAGNLLGSMSLSFNGAANGSNTGILKLAGNNTYSGGTTVNGGTLQAGSATAFGTTTGTITLSSGASLDLNGQSLTNAYPLIITGAGVGNGGALTNSSMTPVNYTGSVTLVGAATIGGTHGALTISGVMSDTNNYGLVLVGSAPITLSNVGNTLSTIASGGSVGAISILNNSDLTIGSVSISNGSTYSGLSSVGQILLETIAGNLTVSQNISTSSTSAAASSPALLLAAGKSGVAGSTTYNIILSGAPNISIGSGAIADFYSGSSANSTGLTNFVTSQTLNSVQMASTLSTQPTTAGYNLIYRENVIYIAAIGSSNYGSTPSISFEQCANISCASVLSSPLTTSGSPMWSGSLPSSLSNVGTYSLTYLSGLSVAGYTVLAASAHNYTITPAPLTVALTATYSGSSTVTPTVTTLNGVNGQTITFSSVNIANQNVNSANNYVMSLNGANVTGGAGTDSLSNYAIHGMTNLSSNTGGSYSSNSNTVTLIPAVLTYVANSSVSNVYGTTPLANGGTLTGYVGSDNVNISSQAAATMGTAVWAITATSTSNVGQYAITGSGLTAVNGNYSFVQAATNATALTITPATATVIATKTYDGTNSLSTSQVHITGVGGVTLGFTLGTATLNDLNVGSGNYINLGTLVLSGGAIGTATDPSNYILPSSSNSSNNTAIVNRAPLGISASLTYSASTNYINPTNIVLTGLVSADSAATVATMSINSSQVSANGMNYVSALTLSGATINNYAINTGLNNVLATNSTNTVLLTPITLTVTGTNTPTKVYDGTSTAVVTGGSLSGVLSVDAAHVGLTQSATYSSANVGTAISLTMNNSISGIASSNYSLTQPPITSGNITAAPLGISVTGVYNGTLTFTPTTYTMTGLVTVGGVTQTLVPTSVSVNSSQVSANGANFVTSINSATGTASLSNYQINSVYNGNLSQNTSNTATVIAAPLGISVAGTYSGTTSISPSSYNLTGLVNGETLVPTSVTLASQNVSNNGSNFVTAIVGYSGTATLGNYQITQTYHAITDTSMNTATINAATLTVTAVDSLKFITQADNIGFNGVVYSGFANGENSSVLNTSGLAITRTNASINTAGNYSGVLRPSGLIANGGNYTFNYVNGNYTIVPADALAVSVANTTTVYGTAPVYSVTAQYLSTLNGVVNLNPVVSGNVVTINDGVGGSAQFNITASNSSISNSGSLKVGSYSLVAGNQSVVAGQDFSNNLYLVGALSVTPKAIAPSSIIISGLQKTYDGSPTISNVILNASSNLIRTGDVVSIQGSGAFADSNVASGKSIAISPVLLGADANNYYLTNGTISTTGTITQLASVTYTGPTGGSWSLATNWANGAIPTLSNVAQVVIPSNTTVVYDTANLSSLTPTSSINNSGVLSFNSSTPTTMAYPISGTGSINQSGSGVLTLTGTNSYSGGTNINGSTLIVGSAHALGTGQVISSNGILSVASGITLPSLLVNGTTILASDVATSGNQTYNGALIISNSSNSTTLSSSAGNITFGSTVKAGLNNQSLNLSALTGSITFDGQVGVAAQTYNNGTQTYTPTSYSAYLSQASNNLTNLTIRANAILLNADITTFGTQTYYGALVVGDNGSNGPTRVLLSEDPSIIFNGTIDDSSRGIHNLYVKAVTIDPTQVPTITFNGVVGAVAPLASLIVDTGVQDTSTGAVYSAILNNPANYVGTVTIQSNVTTVGDQIYTANNYILGNGAANQTLDFSASSGNIVFNKGISGAFVAGVGLNVNLSVNGGTVSGFSGSGLNYQVLGMPLLVSTANPDDYVGILSANLENLALHSPNSHNLASVVGEITVGELEVCDSFDSRMDCARQ